MYIFIDESKSFNRNQKKIVFWWLVTNLKPSTIDRLYYEFLDSVGIRELWWEIKSSHFRYRDDIFDFYKFLKNKKEFKDIEFVWAYCKKYKENWYNYYFIIAEMVKWILLKNKFKHKKIKDINIIADNLKLSTPAKDIKIWLRSDIRLVGLFRKLNVQKVLFNFEDLKKYWWIKFADFIAWILRKKYIAKTDDLDLEFKECFIWRSYAIFVNIE